MKKLTLKSTIKELLAVIYANEETAGEACMASEGTSGCEEASSMQFASRIIEGLIDSANKTPLNRDENAKEVESIVLK